MYLSDYTELKSLSLFVFIVYTCCLLSRATMNTNDSRIKDALMTFHGILVPKLEM